MHRVHYFVNVVPVRLIFAVETVALQGFVENCRMEDVSLVLTQFCRRVAQDAKRTTEVLDVFLTCELSLRLQDVYLKAQPLCKGDVLETILLSTFFSQLFNSLGE